MNTTDDATLNAAKQAYAAGQLTDAADLFQEALHHDPMNVEALHLLGVTAYQLGQPDAAEKLIARAVELAPTFAEAHSNLATVRLAQGQLEEALKSVDTALAAVPNFAAYHFNRGNVLTALGRGTEAFEEFNQALKLDPGHAPAALNAGLTQHAMGDLKTARRYFEQAISIAPTYAEAFYNLANVKRDTGDMAGAEKDMRAALTARPGYAAAYNSLGNILADQGRNDEALTAFEAALEADPEYLPAASNALCTHQYLPGVTAKSLQPSHEEWYWLFATRRDARPASAFARTKHRPLKVAVLSPDLGQHPVAYLSANLWGLLDPAVIETHAFSTRLVNAHDEMTEVLKTVFQHWHDVAELSDDDLLTAIRTAGIDILFDLSGHTAGNRLLVFAERAAPVQLSWLGYVGSTGLPTIDYVLADRHQVLPEHERYYAEGIARMPNGYACYSPPEYAPDVGPLPALENGYVTFGCLNNPAKLNGEVMALFARVLQTVADSRLLLRFKGLDDPAISRRLKGHFRAAGIDSDRIIIEGAAPHAEFLNTYNRIDIALDTFPYSGGLTTCEAIWMGVPVITLPGDTFAGRHSASHVSTAGYPEWIARDPSDYVARAVRLAHNLEALDDIRQNLRSHAAASPLCDAPRFTEDFTQLMLSIWEQVVDA